MAIEMFLPSAFTASIERQLQPIYGMLAMGIARELVGTAEKIAQASQRTPEEVAQDLVNAVKAMPPPKVVFTVTSGPRVDGDGATFTVPVPPRLNYPG